MPAALLLPARHHIHKRNDVAPERKIPLVSVPPAHTGPSSALEKADLIPAVIFSLMADSIHRLLERLLIGEWSADLNSIE